jgi:DNA-binding transcriptional ArsR family regulator
MNDDTLDERLRALAHPDRRRFLSLCRGRSRSAGDLAAHTTLSDATVSEHLRVLRKTGLLTLDRQGRHWLYLADELQLIATLQAAEASVGIVDVG